AATSAVRLAYLSRRNVTRYAAHEPSCSNGVVPITSPSSTTSAASGLDVNATLQRAGGAGCSTRSGCSGCACAAGVTAGVAAAEPDLGGCVAAGAGGALDEPPPPPLPRAA